MKHKLVYVLKQGKSQEWGGGNGIGIGGRDQAIEMDKNAQVVGGHF